MEIHTQGTKKTKVIPKPSKVLGRYIITYTNRIVCVPTSSKMHIKRHLNAYLIVSTDPVDPNVASPSVKNYAFKMNTAVKRGLKYGTPILSLRSDRHQKKQNT